MALVIVGVWTLKSQFDAPIAVGKIHGKNTTIVMTTGQAGVLFFHFLRITDSHSGDRRIVIANSESTPGVNGSNRCGAAKFTSIWQANKKPLRMRIFRLVSRLRAIPQPPIVTNNGAANPPSPDITNARTLVIDTSLGVQVAAECTITISRIASARNWSGWVRRSGP